jgi:hypothetical protein
MMEIEHHDQLAGSPAEPLAVKIWAELHEKGWVNGLGPGWDNPAVILVDGRTCVGFIAWQTVRWRSVVSVNLGGVKVASRGHRLYDRLFVALCDRVRRDHDWVRAIESGYHIDNLASAAMHRRLGRKVVGAVTSFPLR